MDLRECYIKGLIQKTAINLELIKSVIEMSNIKENTVKTANIDKINISAYVSMAYDSLREILEAICISKGYKVLSYVCLGELLKTIIDDFDFNEFDRLRYARNGVNYYGVKIEYGQGKAFIEKIFAMKAKLLEKYLEKGQ